MFRFLVDNNITRYINQNKDVIILGIGAVIFIILLIKGFNMIIFENNAKLSDINASNDIREIEIERSRQTILEDEVISRTTAEENYNLITEFIEYCNNGETRKAYNLLSDECKEKMFTNINSFYDSYVSVAFKTKKLSEIRSWNIKEKKYTYIVTLSDDILSTGVDGTKYQDYITVDDEIQKLNINRYIGRFENDINEKIDDVEFNVNYVDVFKDYEIYNIKVSNHNNKKIILDDLKTTSSTYLTLNNNRTINCSSYEAGKDSFEYNMGMSKNINLKFLKQYDSEEDDEKLVFSRVILDTNNMENTSKFEINL